jgi:ferredoxin-NADP reductase
LNQHKIICKEVKRQNHDTKIIRFQNFENDDFNFEAGQFVMLSKEDFVNDKNRPVKRAYSICNAPYESNIIEFLIQILPNGKFTSNVLDFVKSGDKLSMSRAHGRMVLNKKKPKGILLFAAGIRICPIRSILREYYHLFEDIPILLFYCARNKDDFHYIDEFLEYEKNRNFKIYISFTSKIEKKPNEWIGIQGRMNEKFIKDYISNIENINEYETYICTPKKLFELINNTLTNIGLKQDLILHECW